VDTAYLVVTVLATVATGAVAAADLARAEFVLTNSASVGVPESWLTTLGLLKAAGATGLAVGLVGAPARRYRGSTGAHAVLRRAIVTHVRAHNHDVLFPATYLALAASSLALSLAA